MRRGFTLLEVLLALALLALLLTLVQGAYSGAARSRRVAGQETARVHGAALVLERLGRELAAAYARPYADAAMLRAPSWFLVEPEGDGRSFLSFTTRLDPLEGGFSGEEAEVAYFLEEDDDGTVRLRRRESRTVDDDVDEGGVPYEVLRTVERFDVLAFDGERWLEEWDSRDRVEPPHLPVMVSVEISWGGEEEEEHRRSLRSWFPVYGSGEIL